MKPRKGPALRVTVKRTVFAPWAALVLALLVTSVVTSAGCSSLFGKKASDGPNLEEFEGKTILIGDLTSPIGKKFLKVEGVALVTQLAGTGSNPPPGSLTDALLTDMLKRNVDSPKAVIADDSTALVLVRGFLPPGVRKGDPIDIDVRVPRGSKTKSLEGGWLMPVRMQEVQILDNSVHQGEMKATGTGRVLVEAAFRAASDEIYQKRGRVLGKGLSTVNRNLGLVVNSEHASVQISTQVAAAINRRFSTTGRGGKKGVANPKKDNYIELEVPSTYKGNIGRYLKVVDSIAISENLTERAERMQELRMTLHDPAQAPDVSLQLEAIGEEGAPILLEGLSSNNADVRFYSAEALAYLDHSQAAGALEMAASHEPTFRWHALTALAAMDHVSAYDALTNLLHEPSAETRYGAFRALRERSKNSPEVAGIDTGDFYLHQIATHGPPMIHFSQTSRPEVVLFGLNQRVDIPEFVYAGPNILVKQMGPTQLRVTKFEPGASNQVELCHANVASMVSTIAKMEGSYLDVLDGLRNAKAAKAIEARVVLDARPNPRKILKRFEKDEDTDDEAED